MNDEFVNDLRERLQNLYDWVIARCSDIDGFICDPYDDAYCRCLKQVLDIIDEMKESPIYKK